MSPLDPPPAALRPALAERRSRRVALIAVVVVVLALAIAWWWRGRAGPEAPKGAGPAVTKGGPPGAPGGGPRVMPVSVATIAPGRIEVRIAGLGTVTPRNIVTVRPRVDGQLMRVNFKEGQVVKAGDVLAQIDPRPFEVQLATAEGQLKRDLAQLQNARADVERYRTLLAQDSIAKQQVDTQEALVRQYEGVVASDRAQVEDARLQLSYARVTAPIGGRVGLRQIDAGNLVRASDANGLVVITEVQPVSVVFPIPQDQLPAVLQRFRAGATMPVEAWDREGRVRIAIGALVSVDNQIDVTTGTIRLKAEFPNEDYALFPNQFVNARLLVTTLEDVLVAPQGAIQRGAPGTFVYVVTPDGTVAIRPVKLGQADGDRVAILSGVSAGDRVVTDGADRVREGARVEVIEATTARPGSGPATPRSAPGASGDARRPRGPPGSGAGSGSGTGPATGAGTGTPPRPAADPPTSSQPPAGAVSPNGPAPTSPTSTTR